LFSPFLDKNDAFSVTCGEIKRNIIATMSKFRNWLYENGHTIDGFAQLINVHRGSVHRWMKGILSPRAKKMYRIKQITKGVVSTSDDLLDKHASENGAAPTR